MTLKGEMALAIVRAILARPEKFSRGLAEAAVRFDRFWKGTDADRHFEPYDSGEEYWADPVRAKAFPDESSKWQRVQELLPEDFAEKLDT